MTTWNEVPTVTADAGLCGTVAVVTGAKGRLGPVWCDVLLQAGARVVAIDRADAQPTPGYSALHDRWSPEQLVSAAADILDRDQLEQVAADADSLGQLSVLVCNAGVDDPPRAGHGCAVTDLPADVAASIVSVNVVGTFTTAQVFGSRMIAQRSGSIVMIGSMYGRAVPDPALYRHLGDPPFLKNPAYGASKAAVSNLARYLARLWGPTGVRVNVLSPGGVLADQDDTFQRRFCERVPLGRMANPADLRDPLLFLAGRGSSYITGTELVVDGGYSLQ